MRLRTQIQLPLVVTVLSAFLLVPIHAQDVAPASSITPTAEVVPPSEVTTTQSNQTTPQATETPASSSDSPNLKWERINVYPPEIKLEGKKDVQNLIVVATRSDGVTRHISDEVRWESDAADIFKLDGRLVTPIADGSAALHANWNDLTADVNVSVTEFSTERSVSFINDVVPIFTKSGCNTGSCHGAARGKDGFRISLFGFDPRGDYYRITREIGMRRINQAIPENSLLLQKATGGVPHTGGKKIEPGSEHYQTLLKWLSDGVTLDQGEVPKVDRVDLYPKQVVMEGEGQVQPLIAVATYSDGRTRDLTDLASFTTNNERTAAIDFKGTITSGVRGEAFVMARFDVHTVGSQIIAIPGSLNYQPTASEGNYIDDLVSNKLQKLRITPSGLCTDEEFVRRVHIDIVGKLPEVETVETFIADSATDKRAKLVDTLLQRKEFSEIWATKWAEILMIKSNLEVSYKAAFLYNRWLTNKIANDEPIDKIVQELLKSNGGVFDNPATNFYEVERDRLKLSENVAQVFMGIRTQCAQCHNHPFDRWTMDDYYGFVAFFSQIGRKQSEDYRQNIVFDAHGGEVNHPVGGAVVKPKFLGAVTPDLPAGKDRREALAEWMTSEENPFFAQSVANRIWAHFTGTGIVEPVDDFRVSNPASNPELLAELATKLRAYKFDFKQLVRDICNSQTYQRSSMISVDNKDDLRNYSHALPRRIPAESLSDCICDVTNTKDKFRGLPLGANAIQIADGTTSTYFLTTFGRSPRTTVCACEASTDPSLSQALNLINGHTITGKIYEGKVIQTWIEQGLNDQQIIERIYLRSLARRPNESEMESLTKVVTSSSNRQGGLEDVFWATLNSREFLFNH
jgi:hypothetical protein